MFAGFVFWEARAWLLKIVEGGVKTGCACSMAEYAARRVSQTRTAAPGCITLADRTLGNNEGGGEVHRGAIAAPLSCDLRPNYGGGLRPCCSLHARRKLGTRAEQPASLGRSYRDRSPRPLSRHLSGGVWGRDSPQLFSAPSELVRRTSNL